MNRRQFMKLGAILVPVVAAPTVAYSFLCDKGSFGLIYGRYLPEGMPGSELLVYTKKSWMTEVEWRKSTVEAVRYHPIGVFPSAELLNQGRVLKGKTSFSSVQERSVA